VQGVEIRAPAHPSPKMSSAASCASAGAGSPYAPSNDTSWSSGVWKCKDAGVPMLRGREERVEGAAA
jgi:hypothetical protein